MALSALKRPAGRGRFIALEGGEGSGRPAQLRMLAERLHAEKVPAIVVREPGGSPGADIIHYVLSAGMGALLGPDAEMLLLAAAREDQVRSVIEPALNQGTWVIYSGFAEAIRISQGSSGKVAPAVVNAMERVTIGDIKPDLTIILDVPVELVPRRTAGQRDLLSSDLVDAEARKNYLQVRNALARMAAAEPRRCVAIDASAESGAVAAEIWAVLRDRFFSASAGHLVQSA